MIFTDKTDLATDGPVRELHEFAQKIGLKRSWFQDKSRHPHYDLTSDRMVNKAVSAGAQVVSRRELVKWVLRRDRLRFLQMLFTPEMSLAILMGKKTQTRRVLSADNTLIDGRRNREKFKELVWWDAVVQHDGLAAYSPNSGWHDLTPVWEPRDLLWVREGIYRAWNPCITNYAAYYQADSILVEGLDKHGTMNWRWKPRVLASRSMPKRACRTILDVDSVRAERIKDISHQDALAEGSRSVGDFRNYWKMLHGSRGREGKNGWVWRTAFLPLEGWKLKAALAALMEGR